MYKTMKNQKKTVIQRCLKGAQITEKSGYMSLMRGEFKLTNLIEQLGYLKFD